MIIGGLQKTTLIDYPGKIAATIFFSGCNFRCPWCHNKDLVLPKEIAKRPPTNLKELYKFLEERKDFLEAVCLSGGEPTIYDNLLDFTKEIKNMGYLVKLDTNGSNSKILETMINDKLLDYVAMDIKSPREKYEEVTGGMINIGEIEKSIAILKNKSVDYEFRTTMIPGLITKDDILKIVEWLSPARRYFLQNFQPKEKTVDPEFSKLKAYSEEYLKEIQEQIASRFDICQIR